VAVAQFLHFMKLELMAPIKIRRSSAFSLTSVSQHSAQPSDRFERGVTQQTGNSQQSPEPMASFFPTVMRPSNLPSRLCA